MSDYLSEYFKYHAMEVAGRTLWWEEIEAGMERYHIRLYYPDHTGNLRLVFINDNVGKIKCTLDAQALMQDFGITYQDLGVSEPDTQLREYERLPSMDHLCTWPQKLYPDGPQSRGMHVKLSPDISGQLESDQADAWI